MKQIDFSRSIDRVIDSSFESQQTTLPKISSEDVFFHGDQAKDQLESYFSEFESDVHKFLNFIKPEFSNPTITSPLFYVRYLKKIIKILRNKTKRKLPNEENEEYVSNALEILDEIDQNRQLLEFYLICLRKV